MNVMTIMKLPKRNTQIFTRIEGKINISIFPEMENNFFNVLIPQRQVRIVDRI